MARCVIFVSPLPLIHPENGPEPLSRRVRLSYGRAELTRRLLKAVALSVRKVFMNPELDPWLQLDLAPREDEDDDGDSYEGEDDDLAYEEGDYEEEEESDEEEPSHDPFGEDDEDLDDDESDSDDEG